jgi:hypothetical protein
MGRKNLRVIERANTVSREEWAKRINSAWGEQLSAIFETGNLLEASKAQMKHGAWGAMCKEDLPFTRQTAFRLITIAADERLRDVTHVQHLPAMWGTLFELTKLTDEQFEAGIASGAIHPKMKRNDVNALRGVEPKQRAGPPGPDYIPSAQDPIGECRMHIRHILWKTMDYVEAVQRSEFFAAMRETIDYVEGEMNVQPFDITSSGTGAQDPVKDGAHRKPDQEDKNSATPQAMMDQP